MTLIHKKYYSGKGLINSGKKASPVLSIYHLAIVEQSLTQCQIVIMVVIIVVMIIVHYCLVTLVM